MRRAIDEPSTVLGAKHVLGTNVKDSHCVAHLLNKNPCRARLQTFDHPANKEIPGFETTEAKLLSPCTAFCTVAKGELCRHRTIPLPDWNGRTGQ